MLDENLSVGWKEDIFSVCAELRDSWGTKLRDSWGAELRDSWGS